MLDRTYDHRAHALREDPTTHFRCCYQHQDALCDDLATHIVVGTPGTTAMLWEVLMVHNPCRTPECCRPHADLIHQQRLAKATPVSASSRSRRRTKGKETPQD